MSTSKTYRSSLSKLTIVAAIIVVPILSFLIYDSKEPFVKPLLIKQINSKCPYYEDFLGRIFYRYSYYPSSIFIVFSSNKVQYEWHKVRNINYRNFRIINTTPKNNNTQNCIASDGNNLVYRNYVFDGADPETFQELDASYYKDQHTVYYSNGQVIPEADPGTFEILKTDKCSNTHPPYSKDSKKVYYAAKVIPEADVNTFELYCYQGGVNGKDKNHKYFGYKIED